MNTKHLSLVPTRTRDPIHPLELLCVVTSLTNTATRRWRPLVAATGLRVFQPGDEADPEQLPALAIHIDRFDIVLSWCWLGDRTQIRAGMRQARRNSAEWLRKHPQDVFKHRICDTALTMLGENGFGVPGMPGDAGWMELRERDIPVSDEEMLAFLRTSVKRAAAKGRPSFAEVEARVLALVPPHLRPPLHRRPSKDGTA